MTPTQSLSERLRACDCGVHCKSGCIQVEVADALDAKDAAVAACHGTVLAIVEAAGGLVNGYPTGTHNILQRIRTMRAALDAKDAEKLADAKDEREDWQLQVSAWKDKADRRADEIELLTVGRELHDELADHLEHELAAQSALLAQAAAALDQLLSNVSAGVMARQRARETLAAIRGEVAVSRTALADRIREATRKAVMAKKPK